MPFEHQAFAALHLYFGSGGNDKYNWSERAHDISPHWNCNIESTWLAGC
jgi:hypothetical protein